MRKRISALLLAALLLSCASCAAKTSNGTSSAKTGTSASSETVTDDGLYHDNLPAYDFSGGEFVIATFENPNFHYAVSADEETGDILNDAIYKRTAAVEERFNIKLTQYLYKDGSGYPKTTVLAGDNAFGAAVIRCPEALTWWQDKMLVTPDTIPNIDLSQPYWDNSMNKALTIGGVQYVALGAFDLCTYDLTFSLVFNKGMVKNYNLPNPYTLVKNGGWTMDAMNSMMVKAVSDLNGDGTMDEKDQYGYLSHPKMVMPGFWIGADVMSVSKDSNDMPYLAMGEDKFMSVFQKIFNITWDNKAYLVKDGSEDIPAYCITMFSAGQSLFMDMSFFFVEGLRGTETDFGVIPYPKYDESQDRYYCRVCYYMPTVVPTTNTELEKTGVLLEALNCESANTAIPAYYEIALKTKYSRDNESAEMFDLIFKSRVVDIGDSTLCDKIRDNFVFSMFKTNDRNLSSKLASAQSVIDDFINKLPVK